MTAIAERIRAEANARAEWRQSPTTPTPTHSPSHPSSLSSSPPQDSRPKTPPHPSHPTPPSSPPGARSLIPSPSPSATPNLPPLPPGVDPDQLLNDTIIPEYSALAVCRLHGLTVAQYLAWLKHPATAQTLADLREISEIRARTLAACSAPQALQQLHRLMRDDPIELEGLTPTTKETMRRSANTILRAAGLHQSPKPAAKPKHKRGGTTEAAAASVVAAPDQPQPPTPSQPRRAPSAGPVDARTTPPTPPTPASSPTHPADPTPTSTPTPPHPPLPLAA